MPTTPPVRLIRLGLAAPLRTQAVYHAVARLLGEQSADTVILTQPSAPYVCLGYHQSLDDHFNRQACADRNLPIVRRLIGGGATYLDSDQFFYQFIFHHSRVPATPARMYAYFLETPLRVLVNLGFAADLREDNELEVDGRRVAGIGGGRLDEAAVVVGNFLFDFDYAAMSAVWASPWPAYGELAAEALSGALFTLWSRQPGLAFDGVESAFIAALAPALGREIEPGRLTPDEEALAARLETELTAPEHLAQFSPRGSGNKPPLKIAAGLYLHAEHFAADDGEIRGAFRVREGLIEKCVIERLAGDRWATVDSDLAGVPIKQWRQSMEAGASV